LGSFWNNFLQRQKLKLFSDSASVFERMNIRFSMLQLSRSLILRFDMTRLYLGPFRFQPRSKSIRLTARPSSIKMLANSLKCVFTSDLSISSTRLLNSLKLWQICHCQVE